MEGQNCGKFKKTNLPKLPSEGFHYTRINQRRIVSTGVYFMLNASATPL